MIRNWITLAIRRFVRTKANSLINLFGLTLGIFVFLLIFIYVNHEFSYDRFHKDSDRVYQLLQQSDQNIYQGINKVASMQAPLYDPLKTDITGIEEVSRITHWGMVNIEVDGKSFSEEHHYAADSGILKILTFKPVAGSLQHALRRPNSVIISESTANKIFGTTDVAGRTMILSSFTPLGTYTIDAVFQDLPSNSSIQINILLDFTTMIKAVQPTDLTSWRSSNYGFMLKLQPQIKPKAVQDQIDEFFYKKFEGTPNAMSARSEHFLLLPLREIYLGPEVNFSVFSRNDASRLYMLATIACFVLLVAGINYVNLTTARSLSRAKEVAVRKVSGASQHDLVLQFLGDSLSMTLGAAALALIATWTAFPLFRDFIGKPLQTSIIFNPIFLFEVGGLAVVVGLIAGLYPAMALSSFKPAKVLKGTFARSTEGATLRNILSVLQFSISSGLIIAVVIISNQLTFIETHDPGYERDHILSVSLRDEGMRAKKEFFQQELDRYPGIVETSIATWLPNYVGTLQGRHWKGADGDLEVSFYAIHTDRHYLHLFGIEILEGRNFDPTRPADRNACLINETAAKTYGWKNPVGMRFTEERDNGRAGDTVEIIGVIKDIHFATYRSPMNPLWIVPYRDWVNTMAIKVKPENLDETLAFIEKTYKSLATTKLPYTLTFFDEQFARAYKSDQQLGKLIVVFSFMAVLIACLGLYGLSTHALSQRLKEIGIRKVLGAGIGQIMYMIVSRFLLLTIVAFVIASPLAFTIMNEWLSGFAFHTTIGIIPFVAAIGIMFVASLLTVCFQTWQAASTNPSGVLRME